MIYLGFLFALSHSQYLNNPVDNYLRFSNSSSISILHLKNSLFLLSNTSSSLMVHRISADLSMSSTIFTLSGENTYSGIKLFSNSTQLYLLASVFVRNITEIPLLTSVVSPSLLTNQVLLIRISLTSFSVISSEWTGKCFNGSTWGLDGYYYSPSIVLLLRDTCTPGSVVLQTVNFNIYTLNLTGNTGRVLIINSYLYIILSSQDLQIAQYDLYLTQIWNISIYNNILVDYAVNSNTLAILSSSSLYLLTKNGQIQSTLPFGGYSLQSLTEINGDFYIFGLSLNPPTSSPPTTGELFWISPSLTPLSQRSYQNITNFLSILPGNSTEFFVLLNTNTSFYTSIAPTETPSGLLFTTNQPFAQSVCDPSCNTCYGNTSQTCYSCRYYETASFSPNSCGICDISCSVCYGPSFSQCSQCSSGYLLSSSSCYKDLKCSVGYFQSFLLYSCIKCDGACTSCVGPSSNDCEVCSQAYYLEGTSCVSACPAGTYAEGQVCEVCSEECQTCEGPRNADCLSCAAGMYLFNGTCVGACPGESYAEYPDCYPCGSGCLACSATACNNCSGGFFLEGYKCRECIGNCKKCANATGCEKCVDGFYYDQAKKGCEMHCPAGTYFSDSSNQCMNCSDTCASCEGLSALNCTACISGLVLFNSTCIESSACTGPYYLTNKTCLPCPQNCLVCSDIDACTTCAPGFLSLNNSCMDCSLGQCSCGTACLNCTQGICSNCQNSTFLKDGVCVQQCDASDFVINSTCYCSETCVSCTSNECTQCFAGRYLINGTCPSCAEACQRCNSAEVCEECTAGYSIFNNTCTGQCPSGYSSVRGVCIECGQRCLACTEGGCIQCEDALDLYGTYQLESGECLENITCIQGYLYSLSQQQCIQGPQDVQAIDMILVSPILSRLLFSPNS